MARGAATAFLARMAASGPRAANVRRFRFASFGRYSSASSVADASGDPTPSPVLADPEDVLGEERTGEGVVTRRHTLGKSLTFIDVTCRSGGADDDDPSSSSHFVFVKAFGKVGKAVRIGATIRYTGRELTPSRPRERDAIASRPGSYAVSVPPGGVELLAATPASEIANAAPFAYPKRRAVRPNLGGTRRRAAGPIAVVGTTAAGSSPRPVAQLCKSLVSRGTCGDPNCVRRHDASEAELEQVGTTTVGPCYLPLLTAITYYEQVRVSKRASAARAAAAVARERDPDDPHATENKASKQDSDRIFADWIVRTFRLRGADAAEKRATAAAAGDLGRRRVGDTSDDTSDDTSYDTSVDAFDDWSDKRHRVADVAGGGGVLSFELHVRHGLGATLCDPAAVSVSARQLNTWKNLRKRASRAGVGSPEHNAWRRADAWVRTASEEGTRRRREHAERVLRYADVSDVDDADWFDDDESAVAGSEARASTRASSDDATFEHLASEFWGDLDGPLGDAIARCDVLVGMHPDQATEPVVDAAIALGKPFAVVPCCVFPELFPDRRTADGAPVRTYVEFVDYLVAKHPDAKLGYLPFKGRNRVVYRL